jgi:parallel beta-helix repeat protein
MRRLLGPFVVAVLGAAILVGLSAAQALANHVQCGDVITQDTTLDSDLIGCPGYGIVIGADNITLDLNGHTVQGNGVSSKGLGVAGILVCCDVTVVNGTIRDFSVGVYDFGENSRIEHNRLFGNVDGMRVSEPGSDSRVAHNMVADSSSVGIWLIDSNYNSVYKNRGGAGILAISGAGANILADNSVIGNRVGIQLSDDGGDNRLVSNAARRNAEDGIRIEDPANALTRNLTVRNGDFGIEAVEGTIDGGGNRAFGNGNPLQCLHIICK